MNSFPFTKSVDRLRGPNVCTSKKASCEGEKKKEASAQLLSQAVQRWGWRPVAAKNLQKSRV